MNRLLYIDNLRIFAIALVALHHFSIIYGASGPNGDYYYVEAVSEGLIENILLILFTATNQAFFMGMLFLVSTFFVTPSYDKKGASRFLKDRLIRLGIPTVVFYFLLSPFCAYLSYAMQTEDDPLLSFGHFLKMGWGRSFGAMWFVEVLIYFSLLYALVRKLKPVVLKKRETPEPFPSTYLVLGSAIGVGIVCGFLRVLFPVGWWLPFFHFQLAHFPQYILMLLAGLLAYQRGWFESLSLKQGLAWLGGVHVFMLLCFPPLFWFGGAHQDTIPFMGGWHWQNFAYSIYEQIIGFGLIVGLLGTFKGLFNHQGPLLKAMSDSTYTVYIIHAIPLMLVSYYLRDWELPVFWKFVVLSGPVLVVAFTMGWVIRLLPGFKKVL
jgi:peptidoglycan/LPS O-acetylase OafA/YrhL